MKKIFFIAIAMIAFTGTMNAQTKTEDKGCADKRDKFTKELPKGTDPETAKKLGKIYYDGCVEGKKTKYIAPPPKSDTLTVD